MFTHGHAGLAGAYNKRVYVYCLNGHVCALPAVGWFRPAWRRLGSGFFLVLRLRRSTEGVEAIVLAGGDLRNEGFYRCWKGKNCCMAYALDDASLRQACEAIRAENLYKLTNTYTKYF
ncbi:hypothetical protein [Pseudomonas sp. NFACC45]|uniref:hypothetical protein n=1 Tax=Pseudomonas sp. NFACC45 TaxID=1566201 RepID=UPI0015A71918|nr:hypothetical protein [Pseudomonas sp. NFACC45]